MDRLTQLREKLRRVAQDPDVDDKKGTQPKKYYKGVDKDKKSARDAHFKKGASMDDDNPNAYKPAPGDSGAKTKPSKHTNKYKKMFGEDDANEACWDGYKQVGMKKKGKKMVPDCVPEDTLPNPEDSKYYVEEGRMVAPAQQIIKTVAKELQKKMQDMYSKRPGDGVSLINQFARMAGMTVSDKKQKKGTLFLKMGDELVEAVDIKKALSKVKGLTKQQMQVLSTMSPSTIQIIINQLSTVVMGEERLADKLRKKEQSKQKAHQKRISQLARQSINKNRNK